MISSFLINVWVHKIRNWLTSIKNKSYYKKITKESMIVEVADFITTLRSIKDRKEIVNLSKDKFEWTADPFSGIIDWSPDIGAIAYKIIKNGKLTDDCDGSARFTHYLFEFVNDNGNDYKVFEVIIVPKGITGISHSHVILAEVTKNGYVIWSNGREVGVVPSVLDYAKVFSLETTGTEECVLIEVPKNNMDNYLKERYYVN